jgi:hypothetical protein
MKKLIVLVSLIVLTACAALETETKRDFTDHTFYASNPNMAVKIANTFHPVDQNKDNGFSMYINSMSGSNIETENFRFSDNTKKTVFVIMIKKIREGYWQSNLNAGLRNYLEAGKIEESGRQYYYALFADKRPDNKYYLVKRYARCSGATNQTLLQYFYVRAIDADSDDFSRWQDPNRLRQDQRDVLTQFKKDSERDIRFIEYRIPKKKNLSAPKWGLQEKY